MASSVVASRSDALVDKLLLDMLLRRRSPVESRALPHINVGDSHSMGAVLAASRLLLLFIFVLTIVLEASAAVKVGVWLPVTAWNWLEERWLMFMLCGLLA